MHISLGRFFLGDVDDFLEGDVFGTGDLLGVDLAADFFLAGFGLDGGVLLVRVLGSF